MKLSPALLLLSLALGPMLRGEPDIVSLATKTMPTMQTVVERGMAMLNATLADQGEFETNFKNAIARHRAAHPEEKLQNFAQLLPHLDHAEPLVAALRQLFAELAYARDHNLVFANNPTQLAPYLEKPFDPAQELTQVALSIDLDEKGQGNVSLSLLLNWKNTDAPAAPPTAAPTQPAQN